MTSANRSRTLATAAAGNSGGSPRRTRARSMLTVGRSTHGGMVRLPARRASETDGRGRERFSLLLPLHQVRERLAQEWARLRTDAVLLPVLGLLPPVAVRRLLVPLPLRQDVPDLVVAQPDQYPVLAR